MLKLNFGEKLIYMYLPFNRYFLSSEQYAVSELLKASKDGLDIDGEILTYLELAQVNLSFVIKMDN